MLSYLNPNPANNLLLEHIHPKPTDHILIMEGGDGWLAKKVASLVPDGQVSTHDRDIRNIENAQSLLAPINNATVERRALPEVNGWDLVLLTIPKERSYARLLLISAFSTLKKGGQLFLAGPTRMGAKAVIKDAQRLFGNGSVLGYRSHQRIACCQKEGDLPNPLPEEFKTTGIAPGTIHSFNVKSPNGSLHLQTCPGIFSWEKIDQGTAILLKHLQVESGSYAWDVGCGYGILGLTVAFAGAKTVVMSDVNTLAVDYAQMNAKINQLSDRVMIFPAADLNLPRIVGVPSKFDLILSNPAFHQGRKVDKSMADQIITKLPSLLKPGGRLLLVANRFLNYDSSLRLISKQVTKLAEDNYFHVIEAKC